MKGHHMLAVVTFAFILILAFNFNPFRDSSHEFRIPSPKEKFVMLHFHLEDDSQMALNITNPAIYRNRCKMKEERVLGPCQSLGIFLGEQLLSKIERSADKITSPENTKVTVLNPKTFHSLCDTITILIEARDSLDRPKTYGGDMFRVKLFSEKPYAAVNAECLYDFQNGTYLAVFRILWEGNIDIQVMLVHPAEAIPLFVPTLDGSRIHMQLFLAGFESMDENGGKHSESTTCSMIERKKPFCNFSNTQVYAPWYCSAPKNTYLNCSHWKTHRTDKTRIIKMLQTSIDTMGEEVLKRSKKIVYRSKGLIKVSHEANRSQLQHYVEFVRPLLRYCVPRGPPSLNTHGYYYNDIWYPFDCKVHKFTNQQLFGCLNGKTIHFFADSTGRQIYQMLKDRLKCQDVGLVPPRKSNSLERRCKVMNVTLHFHFHGLPLMGSSTLPANGIHYAANDIDQMVGGPDTVIFLSYWAHFAAPGLKFFEERVIPLREALYRLLHRSPGTMVFMKGANTRNYSVKQYILISSDWIALQQENSLREFFKNATNFGFIDTWDITQVQPYPDNIHPNQKIVENYIDILMTYVCAKR